MPEENVATGTFTPDQFTDPQWEIVYAALAVMARVAIPGTDRIEPMRIEWRGSRPGRLVFTAEISTGPWR